MTKTLEKRLKQLPHSFLNDVSVELIPIGAPDTICTATDYSSRDDSPLNYKQKKAIQAIAPKQANSYMIGKTFSESIFSESIVAAGSHDIIPVQFYKFSHKKA